METADLIRATEAPSRHLPLAGSYNIRDIGGYPIADGRRTRWRTLLRGDSLHRLDAEAQEALIAYGVRTVIDLRHDGEISVAPNVFAASARVRYRNLPLAGAATRGDAPEPRARALDLEQIYRTYLDERQAELWRVFEALCEPGAFPVVVHCTAGKDRTGLVVALLLALAGVPAETIAEDYALSATFLGEPYFTEARGRAEAAGVSWEEYQRLLVCPPEYMLRTLDHLESAHGGAERYVRRLGLPDGAVQTLRTALVE
jgi:protein-tyrosine phosphatase